MTIKIITIFETSNILCSFSNISNAVKYFNEQQTLIFIRVFRKFPKNLQDINKK